MTRTYENIVFEHKVLGNNDASETNLQDSRKIAALERAWKTRNFEIELYWKRALYFWGFIVIAAGSYAKGSETDYAFLISCIGLVFSIAWFLVNKASKFWQENWECHIDLLEDEIEGKIYKTVMKNKTSYLLPTKGYYFSVSKINQAVNVFVILVWAFLAVKHSNKLSKNFFNIEDESIILSIVGFMLLWLLAFCSTSFEERKNKGHWDKLFRPLKKLVSLLNRKSKFEKLKGCKYTCYERKADNE